MMAFSRLLLGVLAAHVGVASTHFGPVEGNHFGVPGPAVYDYVVVGGGTGGLAVANRLAADGTKTVAVIEAGGFYEIEIGNVSQIPAYNGHFTNTTLASADQYPLLDWGFVTTPQTGLANRRLHYGRGKTLGGSSAQNAMIYNRGTIGSYKAWADAVGDQSWTFDKILPFFSRGIKFSEANARLRAKNATVPAPRPGAYNASGGPVQVSYPNFALPFTSYVDLAMRESGIPFQQDLSSGSLIGSQYTPALVSYPDELRSSSESSYLQESLHSGHDNLKVYTHALAKRIIFSANKTATGVQVSSGGSNTYLLSARREVIVSAGAFQSPQLLMVSGVGPREQLEKHNITVLAERPGVGQNMWDHVDLAPAFEINVSGAGAAFDPATEAGVIAEFNRNRTGPLTTPGADYTGWEKLPEPYCSQLSTSDRAAFAQFPPDWPEIEYEVAEVNLVGGDPTIRYGTIVTVPVSPLSRGNVTIISSDMSDLPLINPNWLSHPADRAMALQALKRARSFFRTKAIQPILIREVTPGANVTSDADLLKYIEQNAFMNWHAACTCKMGMRKDSMAVVDSRARVIGVNNLRVVDASSFALLPPGHPTSTVYVLAEKIAADIIASAARD